MKAAPILLNIWGVESDGRISWGIPELNNMHSARWGNADSNGFGSITFPKERLVNAESPTSNKKQRVPIMNRSRLKNSIIR